MQTNDKDSTLGDRLAEAMKRFDDLFRKMRNLQQDVTERDDTIKSLKHDFQQKEQHLKDEIKRLNDALNESNQAQFRLLQQYEKEMEEKDTFIYITSQEKKLVETRLEVEQRYKHLNDLYAMYNNFNSSEHCCVTQCERTRQAYNRIKAENQELQEQMTAHEENISRLYSQIQTLERSKRARDNYIQEMPTNSNPIVHNRRYNDHENNPTSMNFGNCGCIRNASHHRVRADGSSNYRYPGGTPESTVELLSRPVSTAEISRQSSSSGIGSTADASDGSSHSRKRLGFLGYAVEQSSKAKKFAFDIAEPIDPPTLNVSTLPQFSKQNPSTNGEQKTDRENNSYISDYSTTPRGENTIVSHRCRRLKDIESNQRTPAENEKHTVEASPSTITIGDSNVKYSTDQDAVASSATKMSVDDVDTYFNFNPYAGPSSSTKKPGDEYCSEEWYEDMPPFEPKKQSQKKGETPDRQKLNTTVPVRKWTRSRPFTPQ